MNPFDDEGVDIEIVRLTHEIQGLLNKGVSQEYFTSDDLTEIRAQMDVLIRQGVFWVKKKNRDRLVYDLKSFLKWLHSFKGNAGS